jgi:hypothetical protein
MFRHLVNLISFLDPLLSAIDCGAEITRLGATDLGAEMRAPLAREVDMALMWTSSAP